MPRYFYVHGMQSALRRRTVGHWPWDFQESAGNIYANARPTIRWKKSDAYSFDLTPTFSYQDNGETLTTSKTNISNYGLTLGIVKHLTEVQGLRIGWLTNLAYTYGYENITPKSTNPPTITTTITS